MTLLELVRRTREVLDDWGGDRHAPWGLDDSLCYTSNATLVGHLDDARTEYLTRNPIRDSASALCAATVPADTGLLTLDPRILYVREARLAAGETVYRHFPRARLDREFPAWRDEIGDPRAWCCNEQDGALRLFPAPASATAIRMVVDRLALAPLVWVGADAAAAAELADVPVKHQHALAWWAAARVLESSSRAEPKDAALAARFDVQFMGVAGPPVTPQQIATRRLLAAGPLRVRGLQIRC